MSGGLRETARRIVAGALSQGAQGVRASAYRNTSSSLEWRDGALDRLQESTQMGVGISLYVDGRYSVNTTSDLRPDALERFIKESVDMTRLLAADPCRALPDRGLYEDRFTGDLGTFDGEGVQRQNPGERKKTTGLIEEGARGSPGADAIISVNTACEDEHSEISMVASNGLEAEHQSSCFSLWAEVSVKDAGDRKPEAYWYAMRTRFAELPTPESVGLEAARRALELPGCGPLASGIYPCVIENAVASRIIRDLIPPLSGGNIQQKRSFLSGKVGEKLLPSSFTLIDEPLLPGGLGSRAFDWEGMTRRSLPLFEEGVLRNFFLDTYYARKLGVPPTTGGASNLVVSHGKNDLPAMLHSMGKGILITGFSGGNSNSATGAFSVGIRGLWIENGVAARPISEMNLSGSSLDFWGQLAEVGSDPFTYSNIRAPSLRFAALQFSGT